jgi:hypothetical protein
MMTLSSWVDNGWLKAHRSSPEEVGALLAAADADLIDAQTDGLSPAWAFNIAYNAALHLCTSVLAAAGFRAERDAKHYRTIAALPLVIGDAARDSAAFLDTCRTMRNDVTYEGVRVISRTEADELVTAVRELRQEVAEWLERTRRTELDGN